MDYGTAAAGVANRRQQASRWPIMARSTGLFPYKLVSPFEAIRPPRSLRVFTRRFDIEFRNETAIFHGSFNVRHGEARKDTEDEGRAGACLSCWLGSMRCLSSLGFSVPTTGLY